MKKKSWIKKQTNNHSRVIFFTWIIVSSYLFLELENYEKDLKQPLNYEKKDSIKKSFILFWSYEELNAQIHLLLKNWSK